jgi:glycosyltransferase involved in cell wall biosynthesis
MENQARKRILIIAYSFWPMNIVGAMRPLQVASALYQKGYEPFVLTLKPWDESLNDFEFGKEVGKQISIFRVSALPLRLVRKLRIAFVYRSQKWEGRLSEGGMFSVLVRRMLGALNRLLLFFDSFFDRICWCCGVFLHGYRIVKKEKIDCIFSTSPPHFSHVAVPSLAALTGVPVVVDFRDLWSLHEYAPSSRGFWLRLEKRADELMEKYVLTRATRVIYNTPTAKALMDAKHPSMAHKSVAITNGIVSDLAVGRARNGRGTFQITYTGGFYYDRNPADFLRGLKRWLDSMEQEARDAVRVVFAGRGLNSVQDDLQRFGLNGKVTIHPYENKEGLRKLLSDSDLLLLCLGYRKESRYVIPAKMYDYIGAGKPILAFAPENGEVLGLMTRLGLANNVVTESNPERVKEILEREYARHRLTPYVTPTDVLKQYDYHNIGLQVIGVIEKAVTATA